MSRDLLYAIMVVVLCVTLLGIVRCFYLEKTQENALACLGSGAPNPSLCFREPESWP